MLGELIQVELFITEFRNTPWKFVLAVEELC